MQMGSAKMFYIGDKNPGVDGHDKLSQKWSYKTEPLGK